MQGLRPLLGLPLTVGVPPSLTSSLLLPPPISLERTVPTASLVAHGLRIPGWLCTPVCAVLAL